MSISSSAKQTKKMLQKKLSPSDFDRLIKGKGKSSSLKGMKKKKPKMSS